MSDIFRLPRVDNPKFLYFIHDGRPAPSGNRVVTIDFDEIATNGLIRRLSESLFKEPMGLGEAIDNIEDNAASLSGLAVHVSRVPFKEELWKLSDVIEEMQIVAYVFLRQGFTIRFYVDFNS